MLARRFYAVSGPQWRLSFKVDGAEMGSRLLRSQGARLRLTGSLSRIDGRPLGGPVSLGSETPALREWV